MNNIYNSSTHGAIPLSFEARRLMQNLHHAIVYGVNAQAYCFNDNAIAKARGELAKYMSKLEGERKQHQTHTLDFETRSLRPLAWGRDQWERQWAVEFEKLRERLSMVDSMYGGLQRRTIALEEVAAQRGNKNRAILFGLSERVAKLEEAAKPKPRKRKVAARRSRK